MVVEHGSSDRKVLCKGEIKEGTICRESRRVLPAGNATKLSENTKPAAGSFCFCRNSPPELSLSLPENTHVNLSLSLCLLALLLPAQPVNSTKEKKLEVDGGIWLVARFSAGHLLTRA